MRRPTAVSANQDENQFATIAQEALRRSRYEQPSRRSPLLVVVVVTVALFLVVVGLGLAWWVKEENDLAQFAVRDAFECLAAQVRTELQSKAENDPVEASDIGYVKRRYEFRNFTHHVTTPDSSNVEPVGVIRFEDRELMTMGHATANLARCDSRFVLASGFQSQERRYQYVDGKWQQIEMPPSFQGRFLTRVRPTGSSGDPTGSDQRPQEDSDAGTAHNSTPPTKEQIDAYATGLIRKSPAIVCVAARTTLNTDTVGVLLQDHFAKRRHAEEDINSIRALIHRLANAELPVDFLQLQVNHHRMGGQQVIGKLGPPQASNTESILLANRGRFDTLYGKTQRGLRIIVPLDSYDGDSVMAYYYRPSGIEAPSKATVTWLRYGHIEIGLSQSREHVVALRINANAS